MGVGSENLRGIRIRDSDGFPRAIAHDGDGLKCGGAVCALVDARSIDQPDDGGVLRVHGNGVLTGGSDRRGGLPGDASIRTLHERKVIGGGVGDVRLRGSDGEPGGIGLPEIGLRGGNGELLPGSTGIHALHEG